MNILDGTTPYVYLKSEPGLWTVGYYGPEGGWVPESDHCNEDKAAERVHWLNRGGNSTTFDLAAENEKLKAENARLREALTDLIKTVKAPINTEHYWNDVEHDIAAAESELKGEKP